MSERAAEHAKGKVRFYLDRLEGWITDDGGAVVKRETLAGAVLLAQVEYHEMVYGADWIEGIKREEWFVESEMLQGVERGEGWETLLGE